MRQLDKSGHDSLFLQVLRIREVSILILIIVVIIITGTIKPRFFSISSVRSILLWVPLLAVIGMGEMMVIITRGIDVSVGSMVGVAGMVIGILFRDAGIGVLAGLGIGIVVGTALGALNGYLVAWASVPPVIVTLGGLSAYRGLTFIISGGSQVNNYELPVELIRLSQRGPFGLWTVPWIVFIMIGIVALTYFFLNYTTVGRNIYSIGNNPEAARLRGVPVKRELFILYSFTGAMCGLAALMYASRFGFLNPGQTGSGLELKVIAAVVIGGVTVSGGVGSVIGVLLGCFLLGTINVSLSVLGIAGTWQQAVYGFIILLAITTDLYLQKRVKKAGS
jgi:rhamnose transport system permease protein